MAERSAACLPSSTSTNLVQGLRNREPDSWRRLVRLYGPLIHHWGIRSGLQDHDAADIMQEVLQAVNRSIDRFRNDRADSTFRGWLWVITRNQIRDWHAEHAEQPRPAGGSAAYAQLQSLPEAPPDDSQLDTQLSARALEQIRGEFSATAWQAFWRTAVEQDAVRDVAEDLGLTIWGVYKARARVLRRLRDELGDPE